MENPPKNIEDLESLLFKGDSSNQIRPEARPPDVQHDEAESPPSEVTSSALQLTRSRLGTQTTPGTSSEFEPVAIRDEALSASVLRERR